MNLLAEALAIALLAAASTSTTAQFFCGNEAVRIGRHGDRHVDTPPLPAGVLAQPCAAATAGSAGWNMLETRDGLMECTEKHARPTTCRPSRYGVEKHSRVWLVMHRGRWLQCQYPDLTSSRVSSRSLQQRAVQ